MRLHLFIRVALTYAYEFDALPLLPFGDLREGDTQSRCAQRFHERRMLGIEVTDMIDYGGIFLFRLRCAPRRLGFVQLARESQHSKAPLSMRSSFGLARF